MRLWIIMPYDASPVARAALFEAGKAVRGARGERGGVILATAGLEPEAVRALLADAQQIAGADVPLEVRQLDAGDPIAALRRLTASIPEAILAAPMGVEGTTPWFADACAIGDGAHPLMLLYLTRDDVARFTETGDERHRPAGPLAPVLRACARLHLGHRPSVGAAT